MVGIYKITSPQGKVYIGQSFDIRKRWSRHRDIKNSGKLHDLVASFNQHGLDNHLFELVHELPQDISKEIIDNYEDFYINSFKEAGIPLFNIKGGGRSGKHAAETCAKISILKKGNKNRLGIKQSAETREKISKTRSGKYSAWNKGIEWDEETKKKMSQARMGKIPWNKGKRGLQINSQEMRKKISANSTEAWRIRKENGIKLNNPKGSQCKRAKLTEAEAIKIRELSTNGVSQRELARQFNVCQTSIGAIISRKTWKHI